MSRFCCTYTYQKKIKTLFSRNILKRRKYKGKHSYQEYLKGPLPNSHMFFDCDPTEVESLISLLQTSKSSGPWSIPVNVLHLLKSDISLPLSKIFNLSMQTGTHPDCLKLAKVIPIHKKVGNSKLVILDQSRCCQITNY